MFYKPRQVRAFGIVIWLRCGRAGVYCLLDKEFFLILWRSRQVLEPNRTPIQWVKWREANYSFYWWRVENELRYAHSSSMYHHGLHTAVITNTFKVTKLCKWREFYERFKFFLAGSISIWIFEDLRSRIVIDRFEVSAETFILHKLIFLR